MRFLLASLCVGRSGCSFLALCAFSVLCLLYVEPLLVADAQINLYIDKNPQSAAGLIIKYSGAHRGCLVKVVEHHRPWSEEGEEEHETQNTAKFRDSDLVLVWRVCGPK